MKKFYITLGLSSLLLAVNAQQTLKIKNPHGKIAGKAIRNNKAAAKGNGHNSVSQVAGNIVSNNNYVAGTTMDLSLTINLTNTDQEYGDSLAITFPTGITPNSSPQTTFPTNDMGSGYVPDTYNGVNGQTISWGQNDNQQYGGISTGGITFTVNVTVSAGLTGPQTATFYVSGDTYGNTPGDLTNGSFIIHQATAQDLKMIAVNVATSGCGATSGTVEVAFKNMGTSNASNFPVKYKINGGTAVSETYTATINPDDTMTYVFNTHLAVTPGSSYTITAYTDLSGDGNHLDDTTQTKFSATPYAITYTTGFEASPATDIGGWQVADTDGSGQTWNIGTFNPKGGTQDLLVEEDNAGSIDDWAFSPCLTMVTGGIYKIKYYYTQYDVTSANFTNPTTNFAVFIGNQATPSQMTYTLMPSTTLTPSTSYTATTVTYTATANANMVIGFEVTGANSNNGTDITLVQLDNVSVTKTGQVGIESINSSADLSVYPNPTSGVLNISTAAATAKVELFNIMGQSVMVKEISNGTNTVDISALSEGVYSIQVSQNNQVLSGKIIKTN